MTDDRTTEKEPNALVRYGPESIAKAKIRSLKSSMVGLAGAMGGLAALSLLPAVVTPIVISVGAGIWASTSRRTAAQLDRGDFDDLERKLVRRIAARPNGYRSELAALMLGYIKMRRGLLREARSVFQQQVQLGKNRSFGRYAEVASAACALLDGSESNLELSPAAEPGTQLHYCIISALRGDVERALSLRFPVPIMRRIAGARRFKHEQRAIALIHTSLRGDVDHTPASARRRMVAAYPGEYDYIARGWAPARVTIDALELYAVEPARARAKP